MPQPFPESLQKLNVNLNDTAPKRAMLAVRAAEVVAAWCNVDATMGAIFTVMLGKDPGPGAAIYESIRSDNAKRDAFRAVAREKIANVADRALLDFIVDRFQAASRARNIVAHHLWGHQDELPDAILFVDPSIMRVTQTGLKVAQALSDEQEKMDAIKQLLMRMRGATSVWKEPDFIDAWRRLVKLQLLATTAAIVVAPDNDPAEKEKARQIILSKDEELAEFVRKRVAKAEMDAAPAL